MDAGTSISVSTGADFEVEGTIHLVLFRAVDSCEMLCHDNTIEGAY